MGRMTVYMSDLIKDFEVIRSIRVTETPKGIRLFCFALIHLAPLILAPYWVHFCQYQNRQAELPSTFGCESSYIAGASFVLITLTLRRAQTELEDPFDGIGGFYFDYTYYASTHGFSHLVIFTF